MLVVDPEQLKSIAIETYNIKCTCKHTANHNNRHNTQATKPAKKSTHNHTQARVPLSIMVISA